MVDGFDGVDEPRSTVDRLGSSAVPTTRPTTFRTTLRVCGVGSATVRRVHALVDGWKLCRWRGGWRSASRCTVKVYGDSV